jgi:alkanesulfonate monooxygenase SsuD/methylene tetrahydromethanopterin reductase-like flavin-dependent oxidoreductase (luciferase family)
MRYGLEISAAGACGDARTLADLAQLAEEVGWDGVFLEDYVIHWSAPDALTCDPWVALAAMALRTERIRLGTMVTPIARRRPWKLARELITLDQLSGGRMILGVGLGDGTEQSFTHFGEVTDPKRRAEMLDEGLDILAGLWSGQPFSYDGTHYTIREVTFLPRPVQVPRIPIWVGGSAQRKGVVRRAARWDGIVPYKGPGTTGWEDFAPDDIRLMWASIERQRSASTPFDIAIGGRQRADDWERERALIGEIAEAGATWWMEAIFAPDLEAMRAAIGRGPLRID